MINTPQQNFINRSYSYNNYNSSLDYIKHLEKRNLRKKSNALGFFIFSYIITMTVLSFITTFILALFSMGSTKLTNNFILSHLYYIFIAVFSALITSLMYIVFSKSDINEIIICKKVKLSLLLPLTCIGMGVAMLANYASDIILRNFSIFGIENTINFSSSSSSLFTNILYVISTALVPALAEEFAFRGILMGSLRKYGDSFAIIASAVMFGAMHGNIVQIPFAFILGLIFAYIDCKTNSILPSIIIHFINNFYAVLMDIFHNENIFSDKGYYIINFIFIFVFCILSIISFIYIVKKDRNFFKLSDKNDISNVYAKSLTLKEKNTTFFLSAGVITSLVLFIFETISALALM